MKTETFDNAADFLAAMKRKKPTRPGIPSAGRAPSTGLSTLILAGWNTEYRAGAGYRLYRGALDTGWQIDEAAACTAAKGMDG